MYWCIEKTTSNERMTINNAVYALFADLERGNTLLSTVIEDYFDSHKQEPLSAGEAKWVADMLHIVREILSDSITAYNLTVADADALDARNFIATAEAVKAAMQCEKAHDSVRRLEITIPADTRKAVIETRSEIGDMDDAAAILELNGILENGGINNG